MPSNFIDTLRRYIDERGLAAPELAKQLDQHQNKNRIDQLEFSELLNKINEVDQVSALGLRIGLLAKPQDFGLVGYLLTSCVTLGQALTRYGRFQQLILSTLSTSVCLKNNVVSHSWNLGTENHPLACEFSVAVFINLYQSLIGKSYAPIGVGLPFEQPKDIKIYEVILGCPVEFNTPELRVDISAELLLMTISSSDPYLRKIFDQQAEAMLDLASSKSDGFQHFLHGLQQELLTSMKDGDTRASSVAPKMGYTLRSFYRLLSNNDYSYRSILSDLRRRLAKKYLSDPNLSTSDIAILLGYSEQSAFIRAFKDWTSLTPGEFRNRL